MTVKQMVEALGKLPEDFEVILRNAKPDESFMSITDFKIDDVADVGHSEKVVILGGTEI